MKRAELAYSHDGRIYSLAADGSARRLLAAPGGRPAHHEYRQPAWSPDGSALVFVDLLDEGDGGSRLMISDAAGTRSLTPRNRAVQVASPSWSPDGRRLAFARHTTRRRTASTSIVIAARDGSEARPVVTERLDRRLTAVGEPPWLPDGTALGYTRTRLDRREYRRPTVFTVAAAGGAPQRRLTDAQSATWSPDGSAIAYASVRNKVKQGNCDSEECSYASELYVDRIADAAPPRRLTRNRGHESGPQWSADGAHILFASDRNAPGAGNDEIYSIRSDGACLTWLTNGSPQSTEPAWRPGAGASAEPGRCGAAGRRPLVEVSTAAARGSFWLGTKRYGRLLLSDVEQGTTAGQPGADGLLTHVGYADCGRFLARECPGPVLITNSSVCHQFIQPTIALESVGTRLRRVRGTVAADLGRVDGVELFSGRTAASVTILGPRRGALRYRALLGDLVRVGSQDRRGAKLPLARLPTFQARALRETLAVRPRHATLRRAARALSLSPGLLRTRLSIARALRASGGIRAARCR